MYKKNIKWLLLCIVAIITFAMVHFSTSRYTENKDTPITLSITMPQYTVRFHPNNGGTDNYQDQTFTYGTAQNLTANSFTNSGYSFNGWNTIDDGTGTGYADEESVNNLTDENNGIVDLYAMWMIQGNSVAEVGGVQYETLQEAIDAVPTTGVATTVKLLKDITVSGPTQIPLGKNVVLNLQNFEISTGQNPNFQVIENAGTLKISNGTISSTAQQGVVGNTGTLTVTGGTILATGKQCIYNDGGTVTISGTPFIKSTSGQRAAVHNFNSGTMTITGGTIISTAYYAVENQSTLTIGTKDGTSDITTPVIQGNTYAISHANNNIQAVIFNFYDGILKGKNAAINTSKATINDIETGYEVNDSIENIEGQSYKTKHLALPIITDAITFDENYPGGIQDTLYLEHGTQIGTLPSPVRPEFIIEGWYTESVGGTKISSTTLVNGNATYYAHWEMTAVAKIGNSYYDTIHSALSAVAANSSATIELLTDVSIKLRLKIESRRNIVLDLGGHTLSNLNNENIPIIDNYGTATVTNGTITSNAKQGAVTNRSGGVFNIADGTIAATGLRQGIYNESGGTVNISGTAVITAATNERAAVQNVSGGTINITGGTITGTNYTAIINAGTMTIGTQGGSVSVVSPSIRGEINGIENTGTLNFYDGIAKGITAGISGTPTTESGYHIDSSNTETIDNKTYHTAFLVSD